MGWLQTAATDSPPVLEAGDLNSRCWQGGLLGAPWLRLPVPRPQLAALGSHPGCSLVRSCVTAVYTSICPGPSSLAFWVSAFTWLSYLIYMQGPNSPVRPILGFWVGTNRVGRHKLTPQRGGTLSAKDTAVIPPGWRWRLPPGCFELLVLGMNRQRREAGGTAPAVEGGSRVPTTMQAGARCLEYSGPLGVCLYHSAL